MGLMLSLDCCLPRPVIASASSASASDYIWSGQAPSDWPNVRTGHRSTCSADCFSTVYHLRARNWSKGASGWDLGVYSGCSSHCVISAPSCRGTLEVYVKSTKG